MNSRMYMIWHISR